MLARVVLDNLNSLSPMLTGSDLTDESLKPKYTGLIVYNVNETPPLEKGLYLWEGSQWNKINTSAFESIKAGNGLTAFDIDSIGLGGVLGEHTTLDQDDFDLNFARNANKGKIGIGTTDSPQAILHIKTLDGNDPLIVQNVNHVSVSNPFDDSNPMYYNLRISENGVIRKAVPVVSGQDNSSFVYNLKGASTDGTIPYTAVNSSGGTLLTWTKDGHEYDGITLPEDGTYVFSFRLYGNNGNRGDPTYVNGSFYLSAFINGSWHYTKDAVIYRISHTENSYPVSTCTINITVTAMAGEKITFKMGKIGGGINSWNLYEGDPKAANRTSMFFWRLS